VIARLAAGLVTTGIPAGSPLARTGRSIWTIGLRRAAERAYLSAVMS
jgi:hypothetical protein